MPKRTWKLKKSQGVQFHGPVRIWVSRGVTLVIEADTPNGTEVGMLPPRTATAASPARRQDAPSERRDAVAERMLKAKRMAEKPSSEPWSERAE